VGDCDAEAAVGLEHRLPAVQRDLPVQVVEGLHVAVPQADVRGAAILGPATLDDEGLSRRNHEGRHAVGRVRGRQTVLAGLDRLRELVGDAGDEVGLVLSRGRAQVEGRGAEEARHAADRGRDLDVVGGIRRRPGVEHLELEVDVARSHRRGNLVLEVVPRRDAARVGGQGEPVALLRLSPQSDLEASVRRDVELRVVDDPRGALRHPAVRRARLDRDRDVGGAGHVAPKPVAVIGGDRRLVVDRVGVVAEELPGGKRELAQPGMGGARLDACQQGGLEEVEHGAQRLGDVVGLLHEPLGPGVAVGELAQQVEEIVECLAALGCGGRQDSILRP
jgi:hypothetical protein